MPREAHIERQMEWKKQLSKYGARVTLEKTVHILDAPVIVDVFAQIEGKTFLIEIGDISDKRKIALMELYSKQNKEFEFVHEPYRSDKLNEVLQKLSSYKETDEYKELKQKQIQLANAKQRKRTIKFGIKSLIFLGVLVYCLSIDLWLAGFWIISWIIWHIIPFPQNQ